MTTKVSKCCKAEVKKNKPYLSGLSVYHCSKCEYACDLIDQPKSVDIGYENLKGNAEIFDSSYSARPKPEKKNEGLKGWELLADDDILYAEHFSSGVIGGLIDYDASIEKAYTSKWLHSDGFKVTKRKSDSKKQSDEKKPYKQAQTWEEAKAERDQLQKENAELKAERDYLRDAVNKIIKTVAGIPPF